MTGRQLLMPRSWATARRLTIGIVAAGILFRVMFLGADSFWLDEANSVVIATGNRVADLWIHADPRHPPLFYIILKAAARVGGRAEWAARLPSALGSILSLCLVFVLARRLRLSAETSQLAVALMAVSTVDIWYAREARMYALATAAGLLTAVGLTNPASLLGSILVAGGAALAVYLDYTMIPVLALLVGLWWVHWRATDRRPSSLVRVTVLLAIAGALVYPLRGQLEDIAALADGATFFRLVKRFTGDFHLTPGIVIIGLAAEILAAAAVGLGVCLAVQKPARRAVLATCSAIAFAVANVVLALPRAYSAKQILVTVWPYVALLTAWWIAEFRNKALGTGLLVVSLAASVASLTVHRADWRAVVAYVNRSAPADSLVIVDPAWNRIVYDFYGPIHVASDAATLRAGLGCRAAALEARYLTSCPDVWLVAERFGQPAPTSPTEAWLDANGRLMETVSFARLEVRRYRLP